ncbi:MAG TPA: nitroreductase family deazaflavin-dependent oxidoreductase [Jiangellaceae bacterium]
MPAPRWLARANRVGLNRILRLIAPWAPGFGVVIHRGRRSGRTYRTPVNVFRRKAGFVIALTYGRDSDWVKNVLAAGGCELQTRRRRHELASPRLYRDESRRDMPAPVRLALGAIRVYDFVALDIARGPASPHSTETLE